MENKKLVNILLKDMSELEELVVEIKEKGNFDSLEIEFLHTRAKGIMQLLQMLNGQENGNPVPEVIQKIVEEIPEKINKEEFSEKETGEPLKKETAEPIADVTEERSETKQKKELETSSENIEEETAENENDKVMEEELADTKESEDKNGAATLKNDEVELEEEEVAEANSRLGDSFLKGKSVNDIIQDQTNLEFKLSNRPVGSIRASIGINDRFQYIRELFDGSPEKFTDTVTSLDEMNNINEAVVYLQQNFKWKKNETSLKFVNLVKRRFTNV